MSVRHSGVVQRSYSTDVPLPLKKFAKSCKMLESSEGLGCVVTWQQWPSEAEKFPSARRASCPSQNRLGLMKRLEPKGSKDEVRWPGA